MKFIATSSVGGDETQSFDVKDYKGTFGEFVEEVLTKYKSEWGEFKIKNTAWFVPSSFEYKHGKLLKEIPQDLLDKKIVKVRASGGWSNMDYYLYLENTENNEQKTMVATTMNKVEYIKSLGWVFDEYWNNRAIYNLGKDSDSSYALFEHQGEVGIVQNGEFDYCNLNEDDIKEFTKALNTRNLILHNPDKYKVSDLFDACKAIEDILNDFADKED